jgi:hypothetical protein
VSLRGTEMRGGQPLDRSSDTAREDEVRRRLTRRKLSSHASSSVADEVLS